MAKIKIAILATSLVPPHPAGTQILEVIDCLSDEFEFTVFAREVDKGLTGKVKFVRVPIPLIKPLLFRYSVQFFLYARLFKRLKLAEQYDIVHAIEPVTPYATLATMQYCAEAAKLLIRTGVVKYKGWRQPYYKVLLNWGARMEKVMVKNKYLRGVIVPSKGLQADILRYHEIVPEVTIIPNGVNLARYQNAKSFRAEMRKKLGIGEDEFVGIIVGLGDWERKGLGFVIEAISLLEKSRIKIVVIGGGNIDFYKNQCLKKGIQDSFVFIDITHELEKYYGLSDFFILPTANEAWSVVTLIAAAARLPLLATKVNGVEDFIIEGENGFFIKRDPHDVANKIIQLSNSNIEVMGRNSAEFAQKFDTKQVARLYAEYYYKFVSARNTKSIA